jgi:hypothetical protein
LVALLAYQFFLAYASSLGWAQRRSKRAARGSVGFSHSQKGGPGCHGAISPDGQWIVTESWYGSDPVEIYLYRRGEIEPRLTLAAMAPSWHLQTHVHPAFSRDGKRVYLNYNAPGSPGSQVYYVDLAGIMKAELSKGR